MDFRGVKNLGLFRLIILFEIIIASYIEPAIP